MNDITRRYMCVAKMNNEFILVETCSGYRSSIRDPQGAQHILSPDESDKALGDAMKDALSRSRFVLPEKRPDAVYPPDVEFDEELYDYRRIKVRYDAWVTALKGRFGYKTKRALFEKMRNCSIELTEGRVIISPSHHDKLDGWSGDGITEADYVVLPGDSSPEVIGAGLRLAFSRCT